MHTHACVHAPMLHAHVCGTHASVEDMNARQQSHGIIVGKIEQAHCTLDTTVRAVRFVSVGFVMQQETPRV